MNRIDPMTNKNTDGIAYSGDKIKPNSEDQEYGLIESELDTIINYIESNKLEWFKKLAESNEEFMYLRRETTDLARNLLVTENEDIFIHLKAKNIKQIGSGKSSRVTLSLKYNSTEEGVKKFEKIANAVGINVGYLLEGFNVRYERQKKIYQHLKTKNIEGVVKHYYYHTYRGKKGINKPSLLMEYCDKGTLKSLITNGKLSNFEEKKRISEQIFMIMAKVHQAEITHGDLTLTNILFQGDAMNVKLIDFADGAVLEGMSEFEKIGRKVPDIHLLGQVLYCVCTEKTSEEEQQEDFENFVKRLMESDSKELKPIEKLIFDLLFPVKLEDMQRAFTLINSKNKSDKEEGERQYCELFKNVSIESFLNRLNAIPAKDFNIK